MTLEQLNFFINWKFFFSCANYYARKKFGSCKLSDHMVYNFRPVPNTDQEKKRSPIIDQGCRYQTMVSNNRPGVSISDQVKKNNILIIFYSFFIILLITFYIVYIELLTCFWKRNFFQSNFLIHRLLNNASLFIIMCTWPRSKNACVANA